MEDGSVILLVAVQVKNGKICLLCRLSVLVMPVWGSIWWSSNTKKMPVERSEDLENPAGANPILSRSPEMAYLAPSIHDQLRFVL